MSSAVTVRGDGNPLRSTPNPVTEVRRCQEIPDTTSGTYFVRADLP
jgi:hypothetical protein